MAIDLGKQSFHLYGIDGDGVITKLAAAVATLAPAVIAMEAGASAHHWGRLFICAGSEVRLINPRFVKPFVKGSKNDATDAEAIYEAAMRPTMRFVPVKSTEQQDIQALHRARQRMVNHRTAVISQIRGLLLDRGIAFPKSVIRARRMIPEILADEENELTTLAREASGELHDLFRDLDRRIASFDKKIDRVFCAS